MAQRVAGEDYFGIDGQLLEIKRQLRQPNGYPFDITKLRAHLQLAINGNMSTKAGENVYLRPISPELTILPTNGTRTIAHASKLFTGYIDGGFKNLDVPSLPSPTRSVMVYEQVKDGSFQDTFGSLGRPLDELCLTQDQIIAFVEREASWLHPQGYGTFFLFKEGDKFFVAFVDRHDAGRLKVYVSRLSDDCVWYAVCRYRFVFSQLVSQAAQTLSL